jgi:putative transcriptional regulator
MLLYLHEMLISMNKMPINRLKVVLAEKNKTNKWLAEQLHKNETTISRWCTNQVQPAIETFYEIAKVLDIEMTELLVSKRDNKAFKLEHND